MSNVVVMVTVQLQWLQDNPSLVPSRTILQCKVVNVRARLLEQGHDETNRIRERRRPETENIDYTVSGKK